jgi:hypothetical protein
MCSCLGVGDVGTRPGMDSAGITEPLPVLVHAPSCIIIALHSKLVDIRMIPLNIPKASFDSHRLFHLSNISFA